MILFKLLKWARWLFGAHDSYCILTCYMNSIVLLINIIILSAPINDNHYYANL